MRPSLNEAIEGISRTFSILHHLSMTSEVVVAANVVFGHHMSYQIVKRGDGGIGRVFVSKVTDETNAVTMWVVLISGMSAENARAATFKDGAVASNQIIVADVVITSFPVNNVKRI